MLRAYATRALCPHTPPAGLPRCSMPFIMKSRGLSRAVGMSQLLDTSPEIKVGLVAQAPVPQLAVNTPPRPHST